MGRLRMCIWDFGHRELWKPSGPGMCIVRTYVSVNTKPQTWMSLVALVPLRVNTKCRQDPFRAEPLPNAGRKAPRWLAVIKTTVLVAEAEWHFVVQTVWVPAVWLGSKGWENWDEEKWAFLCVMPTLTHSDQTPGAGWQLRLPLMNLEYTWLKVTLRDKVLICIEDWGIDRE